MPDRRDVRKAGEPALARDGYVLLKLPKLPPEAVKRIEEIRAWEDRGADLDFMLGPVRPREPAPRPEPVEGGTMTPLGDGRFAFTPPPLPPDAVERIRAVMEWEEASRRVSPDILIGDVRRGRA